MSIVHGLVIASELELPELVPVAHDLHLAPDLNVRLAKLDPEMETVATDIPDMFLNGGGVVMVVPGAARFENRMQSAKWTARRRAISRYPGR
jgi:hypothetical protein